MKRVITTAVFLMTFNLCFSQVIILEEKIIKDENLILDKITNTIANNNDIKEPDKFVYVKDYSKSDDNGKFIYLPLDYKVLEKEKKPTYLLDSNKTLKLFWDINEKKEIQFWILKKENGTFTQEFAKKSEPLFYCEKNEKFYKEPNKCKEEFEIEKNKIKNDEIKYKYTDITQVEYPIFDSEREKLPFYKRNRYIVIDASSDIDVKSNVLVFKKDKDKDTNIEAHLDTKGSFSVFIKNFNNANLEDINLKIQEKTYSYNTGLKEVLERFNDDQKNNDGSVTRSKSTSIQKNKYLNEVLTSLNENKKLSLENLKVLNEYKITLKKTIHENGVKLDVENRKLYNKILSWTPKDLLITTFPKGFADSDEVNITLETKNLNDKDFTDHKLSPFRTTGGLSFRTGSSLYFTGLKNNAIYTETNSNNELRAKIEEDNQISVGIGLNTAVGFRTGNSIFPTFNIGFFIPFEEDISPFLAIGPGFTISTGLGELSFSGGIAFGKVNSISERYVDKDLTGLNLVNEDLTSKVWKSSSFFSIGINFLTSEDK